MSSPHKLSTFVYGTVFGIYLQQNFKGLPNIKQYTTNNYKRIKLEFEKRNNID